MTILVCDPQTRQSYRIPAPPFGAGDRVRVNAPDAGNPEGIVVGMDGPSLYYGCADGDRWVYSVRAVVDGREQVFPVTGGRLRKGATP